MAYATIAFFLAGLAAVSVGIGMIYLPAGIIAGGLASIVVACCLFRVELAGGREDEKT